MGNYISQTVNGVNVVVKGRKIHIKKNSKEYVFPLQGSPNSLSVSSRDNTVYINNYSYDLDRLDEYDGGVTYDPKKPTHLTLWQRVKEIFR